MNAAPTRTYPAAVSVATRPPAAAGVEYTVAGPDWTFASADDAHAAAALIGRVEAIGAHCTANPNDPMANAILTLLGAGDRRR